MAYNRDKYKSGYKGKFVIQRHDADDAGLHWDVRIQIPLEEGGSTYRSFVNRNRDIPKSGDKVYMPETEDHTPQEAHFEGIIPKGSYGAGKVEIWDEGDYELLEADGDKKYVMDFHGDKLKGKYALVKYKKGFLWVKVKDKTASVIDYTRPTLPPQLWDLSKDPPHLRSAIRQHILNKLLGSLEHAGYQRPLAWLTAIEIRGSAVTYNYRETCDVDVNIRFDSEKLKNMFPEFKGMSDKGIRAILKPVIYQHNDQPIEGTTHKLKYVLLTKSDLSSDAIYDILGDKWIEKPKKVPVAFDPDKAFVKQRMEAMEIAESIDLNIGIILRLVEDLKRINQFATLYPSRRIFDKRESYMAMLKKWCGLLDGWHAKIRKIWHYRFHHKDLDYPAYDFSTNWESNNVIFKYLEKWGYHRPVARLYDMMKGDPYLQLIDQFIPD